MGLDDYEVSFSATEKLLYSYRELKLVVEGLTPSGHGGLMSLDTSSSPKPGSDVEYLAMRRARLSIVLDAVDRSYRTLVDVDRKIVRFGYWDNLPWTTVAERVHMDRRSVYYRRKRVIVPRFQTGLSALGRDALSRFWAAYETEVLGG